MENNSTRSKMHENEDDALAGAASLQSSNDDGSAKTRLIESSLKLFAENGLDGTSTRDIAKAAGLNISLISYHFGGKEGLYKAVLNDFATKMQTRFAVLFDSLDVEKLDRESFQLNMRKLLFDMIPMKFSDQDSGALLEREMLAGLPYAKDIYENVIAKILEKIVGLYKIGQKKGFVRKDVNPYIVFFSMIHATDMYAHMGACSTPIQNKILQLPEQMDEYVEQIYKIFVEGVMI